MSDSRAVEAQLPREANERQWPAACDTALNHSRTLPLVSRCSA